jgi:uroporphyrinogen-III decarboxylase
MTDEQWQKLIDVINGKLFDPIPVGFIIDSPWLPGWAGISTLDYYCSDQKWLDANLLAARTFEEVIFLPGFWAEFGMCTEPSAFGTKCRWSENDLPFAEKIISDIKNVHELKKPNPQTDGLLPFVLNRLKNNQKQFEKAGYKIRFAISRGPLNIASFLLGTTEFLTTIITNPNETNFLLSMITDFIIDWLRLQKHTITSIDGIFILDDIVGFLGPDDFKKTALPHLKRIYASFNATVKFFHNDASGLVCAPSLPEMDVNLFNFSSDHSLPQMKELTNNKVTLLGNIPPRDVLAAGTPDDISEHVNSLLEALKDKTRVILSSGGGMPPNVTKENINAVLQAVSNNR